MAGHGSESYFVIGEGLLTESGEGRATTPPAPPAPGARAPGARAPAPPFRFMRMGPKGTQIGEANRKKLAAAMTAGGGGFGQIPAGFTYLGQFIDHDLTFDKTQLTLGANVSPSALLQGRSPTLDLDSLYGGGPQDPGSAKFYKDDRHLKMGKTEAVGGISAKDGFDLPRATTGQGKAVIPDKRNDENLAIAQTHLAFHRFHNRVVDDLPSGTPPAQRFSLARESVAKHYQWMIRHDYLPRICQPSVVNDVFANGRKVFDVGATPTDVPAMPIEFSVAAFRFGHTMIRKTYAWNKEFPGEEGSLDLLFGFTGTSGFLGGGSKLPSNWIADWRRLYDFVADAGRANLKAPAGQFNHARRIDTLLADPLKILPRGAFGGAAADEGTIRANLAFRNLTRAKMLKLATGQKLAAFIRSKGVNVPTLTAAQIRNGDGGADLGALTQAQRKALVENTPLWFYVLREAELNNGRLKGVGARVVAETFHRAMEGSQFSIVRDPAWRPSLGPDSTTFRMAHLLLFAFEGSKQLLAPLG